MERLGAFLRSIGIKTEERSIFIGFHTIRIAWLFTTIVLMAWSFGDASFRISGLPGCFLVGLSS